MDLKNFARTWLKPMPDLELTGLFVPIPPYTNGSKQPHTLCGHGGGFGSAAWCRKTVTCRLLNPLNILSRLLLDSTAPLTLHEGLCFFKSISF